MKKNKQSFSKTISTLLIIGALTFSTNMNAASSLNFGETIANFFHNLFNGRDKKQREAGGDKEHPKQNGASANNGDSIPLDGGLGILILGAAAFGVKKLRVNKNEKL